MTMRRAMLAILFCAGCFTAVAEDVVTIRLVEGSTKASPMPDALKDVEGALKLLPNMKGFKVVSSKQVGVPVNGTVALTRTISINLKGSHSSLAVTVVAARRKLLSTTLSLRPGKPFVTNLPARSRDGNTYILIVLAKSK